MPAKGLPEALSPSAGASALLQHTLPGGGAELVALVGARHRLAFTSSLWIILISAVGGCVSRAWMTVAYDLNPDFALFERHFENLVGEIAINIEFVKRFGEEFSLEREVHADRTIEANNPGVERYMCILAFGPWCLPRPAKIFAILGDQDPIFVQQDSLKLPVLPA